VQLQLQLQRKFQNVFSRKLLNVGAKCMSAKVIQVLLHCRDANYMQILFHHIFRQHLFETCMRQAP